MRALRNTLPIFRMVWEASPQVVVANIGVRLVVALLPLAMLAVTRLIIDAIYRFTAYHTPLPSYFWWLVGSEFALACVSTILVRAGDYCDTVLADKYAKHVSIRIMEHASRLDLTSYEDPTFQDKLERARVQGTDRVLMIQAAGRLVLRLSPLAVTFCRTRKPRNCGRPFWPLRPERTGYRPAWPTSSPPMTRRTGRR